MEFHTSPYDYVADVPTQLLVTRFSFYILSILVEAWERVLVTSGYYGDKVANMRTADPKRVANVLAS